MRKELRAIALLSVSFLSLLGLASCSHTNTMWSNPPISNCKVPSGWSLVHDGSLNYDFRCGDAPNHYFTCYGAYPGQGNHVAMYLYKGASFNSQSPIAGPAWANVMNPSDLMPLQRACVKMFDGLIAKNPNHPKKFNHRHHNQHS